MAAWIRECAGRRSRCAARSMTQGASAGPVKATTAAQPEWERQPKAARGIGRVVMPVCQRLEDSATATTSRPICASRLGSPSKASRVVAGGCVAL